MSSRICLPVEARFPLSAEETGTLGGGRSKVELNAEWAEDYDQGTREVARNIELAPAI